MAPHLVDFRRFRFEAGGDAGAREIFERLVVALVQVLHPSVRRIAANPGDWGIDGLVGELDGEASVWQAKYFIDGIGEAQKSEIRASFKRAVESASVHGYQLTAWTLCVPCDFDGPAAMWWDGWKRRESKKHGILIDLWHGTMLEGLLRKPDAQSVMNSFFPTDERPRNEREIVDLDDPSEFEHALFIRQLEAAGHTEFTSAKREFFNAELASRDIQNKGDSAEMGELRKFRMVNHGIWEHHYNEACASCKSDRLPTLHGSVMSEIREDHRRGEAWPSGLTVVHRWGVMHQLVDEREAGWTRGYEAIAEQHDA